jgi:hypothetical protein
MYDKYLGLVGMLDSQVLKCFLCLATAQNAKRRHYVCREQ